MNKFILITAILWFAAFYAQSQTSSLSLNTDVSSSLGSGSVTYAARDAVYLLPGFHAANTTSNTLTIKTDHTIVPATPAYLTGSQVIDGTARSLDKTNCIPGTIGGSINVGPSGAATYSLPISVSPGSHGMQPSLGIMYSSQSGNDILGYGWHLSGLSSITRVNQNQYYDNAIAPVTLTTSDKFMLDGQRLISTGTNTYSPENNPYIQVVYDGTKFTVTSQDGMVSEYGGTTDSRFLTVGGTVPLTYSIDKLADPEGNYITYSYLGDNTTGEYRISEIKYTGNANSTPYNTITFDYQKRTDTNTSYVAGQALNQTILLTSIKVYAEGNLAYNYGFSYFNDGQFSKLNQISLTANGNTYNPTIVNWGSVPDFTQANTAKNFSNSVTNSNLYPNIYQPTGDFNGDGITDIISMYTPTSSSDSRICIRFINMLKSLSPPVDLPSFASVQSGAGDHYKILDYNAVDWDNDGKADVLVHYLYYQTDQNGNLSGSYHHRVYQYSFKNGSTPSPAIMVFDATTYSKTDTYQFYYGDFDNNGITDRIVVQNTTRRISSQYFTVDIPTTNIYEIQMNGTTKTSSSLFQQSDYGLAVLPIDFDGDGQSELLILNNSGTTGSIYKFINGDFAKIFSDNNIFAQASNLFPGDINGDGKTDFIRYTPSSGWQSYYSTGTGFVLGNSLPFSNTNDPSTTASSVQLADVNRDGKADIIYGYKNTYNIYLSKGTSFSSSIASVTPCSNSDMTKIYFSPYFDPSNRLSIMYSENGQNVSYLTDFSQAAESNLFVNSVTDGNNNISTITYFGYTNSATPEGVYPVRAVRFFPRLVTHTQIKSGTSILSDATYDFSGGYVHLQGKGFLGFTSVNSSESVSGSSSQTTYQFNILSHPELYYTSASSTKILKNGNPVSTTTSDAPTARGGNLASKFFLPVPFNSKTTDDYNGNNTTSTITSFDDVLGRVTAQTQTVSGAGGSFVTNSTITYDRIGTSNVSRINSTTTTKNQYSDTYSSTTAYTYASPNSLRCTLQKLTVGTTSTSSSFSNFDSYGNPQTFIVTGTDGSSTRTTGKTFDPYGRFVLSSTDVNNYTSYASYRPSDGAVLSQTDINGLVKTYSYSTGGNASIVTINLPDNNVSTARSDWDATNTGLTQTTQSITNGNTVFTYFNAAGQKLKTSSTGYKGNPLTTTYSYNSDGSLNMVTLPGNITEAYTYDTYGRISTDIGLNKNISYTYNPNQTMVSDNIFNPIQTKTQNTDAIGNLASVTGTNGTITYNYFASGKTKSIVTGGSTVSMTYFDLGNQKTLTDPDAGTTSYTYNPFGQLLTQTDAKGQTTTCAYLPTGRLTGKTGYNYTIAYGYSEDAGSKGVINSITRDNISESYSFDKLGRTISVTTTGATTPGGTNSNFVTNYAYDASTGRLANTAYPTGLNVSYQYDAVGNLQQINNNATGAKIWAGDTKNAIEQWTQFSLGNGLVTTYGYDASTKMLTAIQTGTSTAATSVQNLGFTFNPSGQLTKRTDGTLSETFTYDAMDRLTSSQVGTTPAISYSYLDNGNIDKTSFGGQYHYDLSTHLHAVSSVDGQANPIGQTGQLISTATYNIENKVLTLDNGSNHLDFTYGVDGNRFRMDTKTGSTLLSSKVYIGNNEFGYNSSGAATYKRTFIPTPTGICAVYEDNGSSQTISYVHTDYQGSWLAITDGSGTVTNKYSYDAWGRPRDPKTWAVRTIGVVAPFSDLSAMQPRFDRGYTGHEMLCGFGLINMNGRLYDPYLQRFLSPDNVVQSPTNPQSYNRYSYCINNPLRYTDPSGYTWWSHFTNWSSQHWQTIATAAYVATAVVLTAIPLTSTIGGVMLGAYLGGMNANGGQLNPFSWNYSNFSTYAGIAIGGVCGGLSAYEIGKGMMSVKLGLGSAAIGSVGITYDATDGFSNVDWTTAAGGGGSVSFNGGPSQAQVLDAATNNTRAKYGADWKNSNSSESSDSNSEAWIPNPYGFKWCSSWENIGQWASYLDSKSYGHTYDEPLPEPVEKMMTDLSKIYGPTSLVYNGYNTIYGVDMFTDQPLEDMDRFVLSPINCILPATGIKHEFYLLWGWFTTTEIFRQNVKTEN